MKSNQDDSATDEDIKADIAAETTPSENNLDERKAFAKDLPLNQFFDLSAEQTFATLGRVAAVPENPESWLLSHDSREKIQELVQKGNTGQAVIPFGEAGLASTDLLALAARGSQPSTDNLQDTNRLWWKVRETSPIWQKRIPTGKKTFFEHLLNKRSKELTEKIVAEVGFSKEEEKTLFKTEPFSRYTAYTRDYAVIPGGLKKFFKMIPQLIFAPRNRSQLCAFISYAAQNKIKIAPRGRGTWALGGALLTEGGVVLEMASYEKQIKVDEEKQLITVSSSVDFQEAEEALNQYNLTLTARPSNKYGAVGGFISVGEPLKGGFGLNAFGFGPILESVESMRVVTAAGEERIVENDHPDFQFYFGTNGRHGIITEVTLKAVPKPGKHYPFALNFIDSKSALQFLQTIQSDLKDDKLKCKPIHIEFFGKTYLDEINKIKSSEKNSATEKLISTEDIERRTPAKDTVLFVFHDQSDWQAFSDYVNAQNGYGIAPQSEADVLWEERFSPMKLRKRGDLLAAEVIVPLAQVEEYLSEITELAAKLGIRILPVAYILNSDEALVLPQFLTDRRKSFQYYRHFSLVPVLARRAIKRFGGRPYGYGIWLAGLARLALGNEIIENLEQEKKRFDPQGILNPGKLYEIRSRFRNLFGQLLLHQRSVSFLEFALRVQSYFGKIKLFRQTTAQRPYVQEKGDALHRCIKCSACMICPLAQIWEKSGDPKLMSDSIYITPRFKMEYMQRYLYERKKLTQEDVDRFVLCFRCGVAERETVCPISDMLLEVDNSETSPCQKKLPTYDEFEKRLRKDGYDVDGAIARYMDILKTHPGVARAMKDVLGNQRVQKSGDFSVLKPKTDFAIYKVEVDQDRCINCGNCGDEHTTSQRGFWDPRNPRKMVSLDELLFELDGKLPKDWFSDAGGPIPAVLKTQGKSNGQVVYFSKRSDFDAGHQHCNGCLYCVIECPVDAIRVGMNDYYAGLAGRDFAREDVRRINEEARTGGVPTSGTGSTGLFGGKGFDRYMFDFSVIVRPTRDGIREAIDIGVNLGRKPLFHLFEKTNGAQFPKLKTEFQTLDLPTPILLELPTLPDRQTMTDLVEIFAACAHRERTVLLLNCSQFTENFESIHQFSKSLGLRLNSENLEAFKIWLKENEKVQNRVKEIPLVEIVCEDDSEFDLSTKKTLYEIFGSNTIISHLIACEEGANPGQIAERVFGLAKTGAEIIHLKAAFSVEKGYYESADILPVCYNKLLANSLHTQVSLISNGVKSPADLGISLMLGASAVVLDRTPLVALNHEFPMLEKKGESIPEVEFETGVEKLQNLVKSWHKQIREVLGAFGVRDIRRTVGESGRLIDLRDRAKKMRSIVEDKDLLKAARKVNQAKVAEDGRLARANSWKYSELSALIKSVPPPNANLLGDRKKSLESMLEARGDRRWTADMLMATWKMASGDVPSHKVPQTGCDFGGGSLDLMTFAPVKYNGKVVPLEHAVEEIDTKIVSRDRKIIEALDAISISAGVINKHRRPETEPSVNHFPIDAADMSLGSIGWKLTLARYLAGATLKRFTGTGEGGYPLEKYDRLEKFFPSLSKGEVSWLGAQLEKWVATQTATGYFGVTEDTLRRARKIVLKFAQGAKPGLGGHILGAKVTSQVEDLRGVIAGISVFSPFPFHDVYSIEDVTKMIEWLRTINPDAIITVKISTPIDVYHVALGLVTGGADEIQIDATAGGTGAAPDIARNRIAMPLEYGLSDVHKFLVEQGERNKVVLVASGGIRSAYDMAKAIILGADKVVLGTQEIVAEQCNRCGNCEAPGGCQKGITTTVDQLEAQKEIVLNAQWLINSQTAIIQHLIKMMHAWGVKDIRELRGRTDLIQSWGWNNEKRMANGEERRARNEPRNGKKKTAVINNWDGSKEERKELDACGVVSFACTKPVPVESIQTACQRMHNRGNGRGGGILGLGGMFSKELADFYAFQIIVLAPENNRRQKILKIAGEHLQDFDIFDRSATILDSRRLNSSNIEDFRNPRWQRNGRDVTWQEAGLVVDPGDLYRFFIRVKKKVLLQFAHEVLNKCRISEQEKDTLVNGNPVKFLQDMNITGKWVNYYVKYFALLTDEYLEAVDADSEFWLDRKYAELWRDLEDEFVYRRAFEINQKYYIEPEKPEAFVSSMMKDGGIWKLVGYAEQNADYWIVGDAQYVSITNLKGKIGKWFKADGEVSSSDPSTTLRTGFRVSSLVKLISEFQANNEKDKSKHKTSKYFNCREQGDQLEITLGANKNQKLTLIVPKSGRQAVVIYKYNAHIWIGHQRFPTVFSPCGGGSHPFYGRVYEALIHNGDFANYVAMVRFWDQFGGAPQFRTDTEMAAKAYAILKQMGYPQSHIFEAIAPTTGVDMKRLQRLNPQLASDFETIQKTQIAGSPDGPWFFIIADQDPVSRDLKIIGLTDTSVLRPSVFLWQKSSNGRHASIGLVGSEEQACRTVLDCLFETGVLASREPDCAKIIRGGSVEQERPGEITGGGAIVYDLKKANSGAYELNISDKFGNSYARDDGQHYDLKALLKFDSAEVQSVAPKVFDSRGNLKLKTADEIVQFIQTSLMEWEYNTFRWQVEALGNAAKTDNQLTAVITGLTQMKDQMSGTLVGDSQHSKKRAALIQIISDELNTLFDNIVPIDRNSKARKYSRLTFEKRDKIIECADPDKVLVVDATDFKPEGQSSLARTLIAAYDSGWRKFIIYKISGQRYLGAGFGPNTQDLELHLYGSPGQDIGNSMMGGMVHVHANAQNDMAKIIHSGSVVVHGLAGNTGVYGAKGGEIFVRGSVGARWVINSVSSPAGPGLKVLIVGSAMEYLAESLMGGKVVTLGLEWDVNGVLRRKYLPFAGNSVLAGGSSGLVIIYDPDNRVEKDQFTDAVNIGFLSADWVAVYKNFQHLVIQNFAPDEWYRYMERWRSLSKYAFTAQGLSSAEKGSAINGFIDLLKGIYDSQDDSKKLIRQARELQSLVEEGFTGKEWRTLVRQLGQILGNGTWAEGVELLDRMVDWNEVVDLLKKADSHFRLGLTVENGWLYLPIDGKKTEVRRSDFKVLRPLTPAEKERLEVKKLEEVKE